MTARSAQLAPDTVGTAWTWLQAASEMATLGTASWRAQPGRENADWTNLPRVATRTPALAAHSVTTARTFTLRTMDRWGAADRGDDVAAVVSELLTNALRHALPTGDTGTILAAPGAIRLGLLQADARVMCAVADPSGMPPVLRQPDWLDECGRGLQLVASLSDDWGYCPAAGLRGKTVWAVFATSARIC
jgi:anti-sigma regulatory factor (Ser/Thr protein kinase)